MANDDMDRVIPLGKLDDYKVAEGDPDVRGWEVMASDGRAIGKVDELLVDRSAMKVRYLDVDVADDLMGDAAAGDRHVLIPIGYARLERDGDRVMVDAISSADLRGMPTYDRGGPLTRDHETSVRDNFSARSMGADTRLSGEVGGSGLAGAGLSDTASTGGMTAGGAGMLDTAGLGNTPGTGTGMGATSGLSSVRPDPGATAMGSTGMSASHGTVSGGLDLPSGRDATLASGTGTGLGGGGGGQSSSSAGMSVGGTSMGGEALNATGTGSAGTMGSRGGVTDGSAGNSADTVRGAPGLGTGGAMGTTGGMSAGGSMGSAGGMSAGGSTGGSTGGMGGDVSHRSEGSAGSDYMHNSDEDFYATDAFDDNRFYGSRRSGSGATGGADADETIRAAREASQRLREDLDNRGVGGTGNM